jgi:hypothetical protein
VTYLGWRWKLLDLLVKNSLDMFACLSNHMVRAIKRDAIAEHQSHVRDELLGAVIAWNVGTRVWLGGI